MNVAEVSINTCNVEVRSIFIGNRQMTRSIFKQIPIEIPYWFNKDHIDAGVHFNYENELEGFSFWGHVNYFPEGDASLFGRYRNIIWQKESELRRFTVKLNGDQTNCNLRVLENCISTLPQIFIIT